jgi:hypothetical protein
MPKENPQEFDKRAKRITDRLKRIDVLLKRPGDHDALTEEKERRVAELNYLITRLKAWEKAGA